VFRTNTLYQLDTDDLGNPQAIGAIGTWADIAGLVSVSATKLYTTDRTTNTWITIAPSDASEIASVALDRDLPNSPRGFDISPDGIIYGVFAGMELATIDPLTGVTTVAANITGATGIEGIAFAPNGVLYAVGSPTSTSDSHTLYTLDVSTGVLTIVSTLLDGDYGPTNGPLSNRPNQWQFD
jgi:hypothetical protein